MRFVPMLMLSLGLLGVVMVMAGDRQKGFQAIRNMVLVVLGMIAMAALFAIVTSRQL